MSQEDWKALVQWISSTPGGYVSPYLEYTDILGAGRGLVVSATLKPGTTLVVVPPHCLINSITIQKYYPQGIIPTSNYNEQIPPSSLNTTQALSMHLYLQLTRQIESDMFSVYRKVLPSTFQEHPLTWLVTSRPHLAGLINQLPPSVNAALLDVETRFRSDWKVVQVILRRFSHLTKSTPCIDTFLWAWLTVNTRCIHYSMALDSSTAHKDFDLTLCPILDFANHTPIGMLSTEVNRDESGSLRMSSPDREMVPGEQLFLRYGYHPNLTLFTEYGFVIPHGTEADDDFAPQVNIDDLVEEIVMQRAEEGAWIKGVLELVGYWGEWTLHSRPRPPHPSYRLLPALRLHHIILPSSLPDASALFEDEASLWESQQDLTTPEELRNWLASVLGFQDVVSSENEVLVRKTLKSIAHRLLSRSAEHLERLDQEDFDKGDSSSLTKYARDCVGCLWREEVEVAKGILDSLDSGVEF